MQLVTEMTFHWGDRLESSQPERNQGNFALSKVRIEKNFLAFRDWYENLCPNARSAYYTDYLVFSEAESMMFNEIGNISIANILVTSAWYCEMAPIAVGLDTYLRKIDLSGHIEKKFVKSINTLFGLEEK